MTAPAVLALFGLGTGFALLCGLLRKGRPLWAFLAEACMAAGVLAGLALGMALDALLPPVLAVCAASMAVLRHRRGEDR